MGLMRSEWSNQGLGLREAEPEASQRQKQGQESRLSLVGRGEPEGKTTPGRPFLVASAGAFIAARPVLADNETATMPHRNDQRPQKGKLTQAKKVIASGLT